MSATLRKLAWRIRTDLNYYYRNVVDAIGRVSNLRVTINVLRGQMPGTDDVLTMLYVGRKTNYSHLVKKYFVEVETLSSKRATLLTYRKAMREAETDVDVVFVDISAPYSGLINRSGAYLELPDWISMTVPLQETWDGTVQNFRRTMRKNIGRLIRKNNYRCIRTNDLKIATRFYDTFYEPFIMSRHADETVLQSRVSIQYLGLTGKILQVEGDEGIVAAGVYYLEGDTLNLLVTGMPEKYLDNPPVAAMQALYYFSLEYAQQEGLKAVNFMGTRAFPTNGLLQFKRKWGAHAADNFTFNTILFRPKNTLAAARFCERFPMIARNAGSLQLVVSSLAETFGAEECAKTLSDYHCGGLDHVRVVHVTHAPSGHSEIVSTDQVSVHVTGCDIASFSDSLVRNTQPLDAVPSQ